MKTSVYILAVDINTGTRIATYLKDEVQYKCKYLKSQHQLNVNISVNVA